MRKKGCLFRTPNTPKVITRSVHSTFDCHCPDHNFEIQENLAGEGLKSLVQPRFTFASVSKGDRSPIFRLKNRTTILKERCNDIVSQVVQEIVRRIPDGHQVKREVDFILNQCSETMTPLHYHIREVIFVTYNKVKISV